jgi:hypothetical protein
MDHPKSGLPDFGHFKCASRINPTCVVKPAGDTWEAESKRLENALAWLDRSDLERCLTLSLSSKGLDDGDADEQKGDAAEAHARNFALGQAEPAIAIHEQ